MIREQALQEVQPHDADERQATHDGTHQPKQSRGLEEVAIHIDRWEAKVLALSRNINELLSEKMKAAILISMLRPDLQHALIQQADKIEDYKSTRDRVANRGGKVGTQEP